jgi:hypothetical protein
VLKLVMDLSTILLVIVSVVLKIWMKAESSQQVRPGSTVAFCPLAGDLRLGTLVSVCSTNPPLYCLPIGAAIYEIYSRFPCPGSLFP